jgi:hypothetical protein
MSSGGSPEEILDFADHYFDVRDRLEQWEMVAAYLLISGDLSSDGFDDFKAGVIAPGTHPRPGAPSRRAVPDSLSVSAHHRPTRDKPSICPGPNER